MTKIKFDIESTIIAKYEWKTLHKSDKKEYAHMLQWAYKWKV